MPNGLPPKPGEVFKNPALANTMRLLAKHGKVWFQGVGRTHQMYSVVCSNRTDSTRARSPKPLLRYKLCVFWLHIVELDALVTLKSVDFPDALACALVGRPRRRWSHDDGGSSDYDPQGRKFTFAGVVGPRRAHGGLSGASDRELPWRRQ